MKILGWRFERWVDRQDSTVREAELTAERFELKKQIVALSQQVKDLSAKVKTPFINADLADPMPVDTESRTIYVAAVAGLHKEILEPKLKFIISNIHKAMEEETNTERMNAMWVGAVYALREVLRWGDRMVNEQVANQNKNK